MSSPLGSSEHAARIATGEVARRGYPHLDSLVAGAIAKFGDVCWMTDARLAERELPVKSNGRTYHPESVARSRRKLTRAGFFTSVRVFAGDKIPHANAKYRSSHGTTVKSFNWRAIEQKNPFSRRERRARRQEQARTSREAGELQKPIRPRHVAAHAIVDPVHHQATPRDPELERMAAEVQRTQELWAARREAQAAEARGARSAEAPERALPPERPPD